jgi:hypothetical protein
VLTFVDRVQLEPLEVLEVLARRENQVLLESLDCLELQLLQVTLDLLGPLGLLALKVKMETRVPRVIVVNQDCQDYLARLGFQAEKVYKGKRENRYRRVFKCIISCPFYIKFHFLYNIKTSENLRT